jgi:DNA-directed RNA polymerase I, II, and III subunit RPABC2
VNKYKTLFNSANSSSRIFSKSVSVLFNFLGRTFVKTNERVSILTTSMEHPEVKPVFRKDVQTESRMTQPYYTKYEYTTLLATRAQQLAEGARPMASLDGLKTSDPMFVWNLARREIEQRKLPFVIRRQLPNGTAEFWNTQELELIW